MESLLDRGHHLRQGWPSPVPVRDRSSSRSGRILPILVAILGALLGTLMYGVLKSKLPH